MINDSEPVTGDITKALHLLRTAGGVLHQDVSRRLAPILGEEVSISMFVRHLCEAGLAEEDEQSIRISDVGLVWLDEHLGELDIQEETPDVDGPISRPYAVSKLKVETKHISIFQALRKIEKNEINLNPDFQRAFVWDVAKQSRLIESLLIRIPLPAFYLDATDQVNWSVVDGLQRLTTLYRYCRKEDFKLTGLQFLTDLEKLKFSELPPKYQVLIEDDTQLLFYNLMPGTPLEAKFTIFSRVNTGGMQLTPQEIRHALNQGPITKVLSDLAKHSLFRHATEGVVESLRMSDRELILRALSFMQFGVESYREFNELDGFLLSSMSKLNSLSERQMSILKDQFVICVSKVRSIFGKYAYRKFSYIGGRRSPFNKALFETWTVAVKDYTMEELEARREDIMRAFAALISSNQNFERSISSSTAGYGAVSTRFSAIQNLLERVIK